MWIITLEELRGMFAEEPFDPRLPPVVHGELGAGLEGQQPFHFSRSQIVWSNKNIMSDIRKRRSSAEEGVGNLATFWALVDFIPEPFELECDRPDKTGDASIRRKAVNTIIASTPAARDVLKVL